MSTIEEDLRDFSQFVRKRLSTNDRVEIHLSQLMDEWQLLHHTNAERAENVDALIAAVDDFRYGDRGELAGRLTKELRESLQQTRERSTEFTN